MSLVNFPGPKTKTPSVQTLGVLFFGLSTIFFSLVATADCMPQGAGELAAVERVYDGDTVKLKDGRHIRVLGINAPEVDHGNEKSGQALGEESRSAAETFFKADKQIRLFYDLQRVDRYGRTLAHVYDLKGNSLAVYLLRQGLGFHVAIPPNVSLNECLQGQEAIARKKRVGVWSNAQWNAIPASQLTLKDTGFKRITGQVMSVRKAQSIWLELDGPLVIKITPTDLKNFSVRDWSSWKGRQIEVRGWVTERGGSEESAKKAASRTGKSYKSLVVQPRISGSLDLLK
jgi:endonuclease YncB( thermonuclease family)